MDPFSSEGELLSLHNAFHLGQFQQVVDQDTSSLSPENKIAAQVYKLRARIALHEAEEVEAELEGENTPELVAVRLLAKCTRIVESGADDTSEVVDEVISLTKESGSNSTVQVLSGITLQLAGNSEEALAILNQHSGNLEAIAVIVQVHLAQNRTDLALKEVQAAKRWAQDNLLINLAESWVGLRIGGEKYQQAYYVFEELAQAPSTSTASSLVGQAVAELHLGRLEEAEVALQQALQKDPQNAEAVVNSVALSVLSGKEDEAQNKISALMSQNQQAYRYYTDDLKQKGQLFDKAAAKYAARIGA